MVSLLACAAAVTAMPAEAQVTLQGDSFILDGDTGIKLNYAPLRTEFISYDMREDAEKGARAKNQYYQELKLTRTDGSYRAEIDIPVLWLDREIFIHAEGMPKTLNVNGRTNGFIEDGLTPAEFNITHFLTDGRNTIEFGNDHKLRLVGYDKEVTPAAFIYSQPKLRIEDFTITAEPDSLNKYGILTIRIALANSYNFPEEMNVGYDIYDPAGKLQYFDNRDVVVPGVMSGGRDTLEFREFIYGTPANLWTADKPALYNVMLIVKHNRRTTEYIPLRVGFGRTEVIDGRLVRNGKAVTVNAARYNAAADRKTTADELARLKKAGINTIMVDYPQPFWFYDLTDQTGLYVFDQPDINFAGSTDTRPGGTPANNPNINETYLLRTEAAFARSRNHTSIAGWSLGNDHGNGYNLYKTYQRLRANEPLRPVIYNGAAGEWNSDMEPIQAVDARGILDKPAAPARNTRGR